MDLKKYQDSKYTIEEQLPCKQNGEWIKRIYVYEEGQGNPINFEIIKLTEAEALTLLPKQPKIKELNPRAFAVKLLGTPLFNELNKWLTQSPLIQSLIDDGGLTEEELTAFKAQLDLDLGEQKISEELYNAILGELNNEG